jgi:hypothetical protein
MTTTLIRRTGVLALIAATTAGLTGCSGVIGAKMTYNDTETAKITEISLSGGSGDVQILPATDGKTTIQRVIHRTSNPGSSYRLVGSTLNVDTGCGVGCSASYVIHTPAGVAVHGDLHSGDVTLDGVGSTDITLSSGDAKISNDTDSVKVRTDSGDITVTHVKGGATLQASSGDIKANDIGKGADLKASSGDITASLTAAASVTARASSGDIHLTVPVGAYHVEKKGGSGDLRLRDGVTNDSSSQYVLDLKAGSGDVTVDGASA